MELRNSPVAAFFVFLGLISWSAPAQEWPVHGGTEKGQYFSPLDQINQQTVSRLGLVWSHELGTTSGLEATPIVQDGAIYATAFGMALGFAAVLDEDEQIAAIHALVERFADATNAKDVKAFGSVFTEDGEFTNPVGMSAKGRTAIEQFHKALFSEANRPSFAHAHLTILGTSIRFIRSDVASVDVKWEQTGAISPEGKPWGTRRGILSWIVTQDHGKWLIAVWHNLELPSSR